MRGNANTCKALYIVVNSLSDMVVMVIVVVVVVVVVRM